MRRRWKRSGCVNKLGEEIDPERVGRGGEEKKKRKVYVNKDGRLLGDRKEEREDRW